MIDPNEPRLPPTYYKAKTELAEARRRHNAARTQLALLEAQRDRYEAENDKLERGRNQGPVISAAEALARGSGSGFRVRYQHPITDAQLDEARKALAKAERQFDEARSRLNDLRAKGATHEPAKAAERLGTKWVAGVDRLPLGTEVFHRGAPIPEPVLRSLGYAKFQSLLRTRFVEQVIP